MVNEQKTTFFTVSNMAKTAILAAISFILYMFVKFPLPFMFPSFLDIQFSDLPALLGGFAMGPWSAGIIIVVKCLIKMPFSGTGTVGEWGDIIIGLAFVLPAAFIYQRNKNKKNAILAMGVGAVACLAAAVLVNRFLLIPYYANWLTWDTLLNMTSVLYPDITKETFYNYYLWLAVVPFNALRCLVCGALTYFVYKPLSKALHWERKSKQPDEADKPVD